jgi:DNA-binding GntR family transcriptional regulator
MSHNKNIFEELKLSIMEGKYKPREHLMERALAAQFGVSRTPIREAFRRLEAIGMVQILPNQGARVADFSPEEIESLYLVRNHLEQLAVKLACNHMSSQDIKALIDINQDLIKASSRSDIAGMIEENYRFHRTLSAISKNPFLINLIEVLRSRCFPCSYYFWRIKKNVRFSIEEHNKIIKALEKRDSRQLFLITEKHLNNSKNVYLTYLSEI